MSVLHNMSMPPRTRVHWLTGGVGGPLVAFALGSDARAALRRRARSGRGAATLRDELDAAWGAFGLRGAALLYEAIPELPAPGGREAACAAAPAQRLAAIDPILVANVLARARSGLLLPELPLELGSAFVSRTLWSDDPRLVALARGTGIEEIP